MDMKLRKVLRDFINWQRKNQLLKNELTIDYELAETYLEEKGEAINFTGSYMTKRINKKTDIIKEPEKVKIFNTEIEDLKESELLVCEHDWELIDCGGRKILRKCKKGCGAYDD